MLSLMEREPCHTSSSIFVDFIFFCERKDQSKIMMIMYCSLCVLIRKLINYSLMKVEQYCGKLFIVSLLHLK